MPTPRKLATVEQIRQLATESPAIYFVDLSRLDARTLSELRRNLRKAGVRLYVAKNRLTLRALAEAGVTAALAPIVRGPTALLFSPASNQYAGARILRELAQKDWQWKFKGAYVEQSVYDAGQFELLATMPSLSEIRASLVGALLVPLVQLSLCLSGPITGLASGLEELARKRA